MNCTNCGAKVDDRARFCPECGHKLKSDGKTPEKSANDPIKTEPKPVRKSTYESIKKEENLIENENNSQKSDEKISKIKKFVSSFNVKKDSKKIDTDKKDKEIAGQIFDNGNSYSHLNKKIEANEVSGNDIPPSYYGYNPVENRQRKDFRNPGLINTDNPAEYVQNKILQSKSENKVEEKIKETKEQVKPNNLQNESNLSTQMRIAQNIGQKQGFVSKDNKKDKEIIEEKVSYDDIPKEFVEARIARQINGGGPKMTYNKSEDNFDQNDRTNALNRPLADENQEQISSEEVLSDENPDINEVKEDSEENKKEGFKFKPIYLLPLLIIALAVAGAYFLKNRKPAEVEIDLSDYIDVTYNGDDGAATPSASLDTSKLLADHGNDIAYVNKDRKNDQYSSPANQFVEELEKSTTFQFSKDNNI